MTGLPQALRRVRGGAVVQAEELGYHAATEIRRSPGSVPRGGSGDYHLRLDRETIIKQSRAYDRDNALFQGLHRVAIDNILGSGFVLQATTANTSVNKRLEKLWKEDFCKHPEIRGLFKWHQVEKHLLSGIMVAGDIGAVKLKSRDPSIDGRLQLVEAEQIDAGRTQPTQKGNRIQGGIETDRYGRIVKIYTKDFDAKSGRVKGKARGFKPVDFILAAYRRRPSQTRGIPALVASFPDINRLDDILTSEAASWQILSRLAFKRKQIDAEGFARDTSKEDDNTTVDTHTLAQRFHDVGMALIVNCQPGEDIEAVKHDIPAPTLNQSVQVFVRMLGLPLGLPLELALLDWSDMNYSSARASLEQAFLNFLCWQILLADDAETPVYEWQVRRWVRKGKVPNRPDILRHAWIAPQFPWLDQLKEAQAWGLKLDRGLSTHGEALKSLNRDRGDWLETREREISEAMAIADRLNEGRESPEPDLWKHFCGLGGKTPQKAKKGESTPPVEGPEGPDEGEDEPDAAPDTEAAPAAEGPVGVRGKV